MNKYLINNIYQATEGEGVRIGTPQIFVRFQGCTIGCINCDSKETWDFDDSYKTNLESIMDKVISLSRDKHIEWVSITGGDPLHPKNAAVLPELISSLKSYGYKINIEASGSRVIDEIFDAVDFISFDYKTPSTGVRTNYNNLVKLVSLYSHKAQIKSVIADIVDFENTCEVKKMLLRDTKTELPWVLTPCYEPGTTLKTSFITDIYSWNIERGSMFRVIAQQHKIFYGPDKRDI